MGWGARSGKYGTNDAGQKHHLNPATAGTKREFIGSGMKRYRLTEKGKNPRTISAHSIEEARRIAASLGYFSVKERK